jgi:hypothetical protein
MLDQPRRFHLQRDTDPTGISGTGRIADGIAWTDGTATIQWLGERPSITTWYRPGAGMSDAEWVHTHGFTTDTRIVWDEGSPDQTAVLEAEMRSKHSAITWRDMASEAEEATRRERDEAQSRITTALGLHDEHLCRECREPNCQTRRALTGDIA